MTASLTIRDNALWAKHVHDSDLRSRLTSLAADDPIRLVVDGLPIRFRKMKDGLDGRPTPGLRADSDDPASHAAWSKLQERRGDTVPIELDVTMAREERFQVDPYLAYLDDFLWEWRTPEDAAAFDGL